VISGAVHVEYVAPSPHVRDLSLSGCYILDARTLHTGQTVRVRLIFSNGDAVVVHGMVRRVDEGVGMALEFISIESADRQRLKLYVEQADPGSVSPAGSDIF
ncbi:MAG TPA: PilZ domain-containing protein, partial [Candidatus Acidoferrales bacterium]